MFVAIKHCVREKAILYVHEASRSCLLMQVHVRVHVAHVVRHAVN